MKSYLVIITGLICLMFFGLPSFLIAEQNNGNSDIFFIEPGPVQWSTLYADGSMIELHGEIVTWPMIGSDMTGITLNDFKEMMLYSRRSFERNPHKIVISGAPRQGLNIVFNVTNPPAGAQTALDSVAAYIERQFGDPITVTINVDFQSMGPGILGGTSNYYAGAVTWTNSRNGLINGIDSDDSIQTWLPSGSTIPVRYTYGSATITNETQCFFSRANYNATIGTLGGSAADMTFNTDFTWDYDPSNGITGGTVCFQSVAIHETGHVLGFTSGADFRTNDIECLDVYRFQRSDGTGDYNPDDLTEFSTLARMVDKDNGTSTDDVNSDMIAVEYRMADGNPYQASHFSQGNVYAIMQPAISYGQTYYPDFFKTPDKDMLDAIGWDYPPVPTYLLTINIVGNGSVAKNPNLSSYPESTVVELTASADAGWTFDSWSGALAGSTNPDTIIMDSDKTVTATFTQNQYTLTINTIGNGSVTKNPNQAYYTYGQNVVLTALPDSGWMFAYWSGDLNSTANPDTITINDNKTVSAHFIQTPFALIINIDGNGSVTKDPNQAFYSDSQEVVLTAIADPHWKFDHWSGDLTGSTNPDTIIMDTSKTVNAHFIQNQYTLDITIDGNGSVTKNPEQTYYTYGQEVELTAIPDLGWGFDHWSGDLTGNTNPDTIAIDTNKAVTAHFTAQNIEEQIMASTVTSLELSPNPFSNNLIIKYSIAQSSLFEAAGIDMRIYDISGRLIKGFNHLTPQPLNQTTWDGTDNAGNKVASGIYFFKFAIGKYRGTRTILLLR